MEQLQFLLSDINFQVGNFLLLGGDVLILIALAIFVMWGFIVERALFFYVRYPGKARGVRALWDSRTDHHSWQAHQIRHALINALRQFEGTMLFVSHDRHFLAELSNRVLELTPEGVHTYGGGYSEYVQSTGQEAPGLRS